jgi:hypothetical protein
VEWTVVIGAVSSRGRNTRWNAAALMVDELKFVYCTQENWTNDKASLAFTWCHRSSWSGDWSLTRLPLAEGTKEHTEVRLGRRPRRERTRVSHSLWESFEQHEAGWARRPRCTNLSAEFKLKSTKNVSADAAETHSPDSPDDFLLEVLRRADCSWNTCDDRFLPSSHCAKIGSL